MAKGPRLKDVLKFEKAKKAYNSEQSLKKEQKFKELETNQPIVVTKDDLLNSGLLNEKKNIIEDIVDQEIKSMENKTLSKKEQRKLAKLQKKKAEELEREENDDDEEEQEIDIENLAVSGDSESDDSEEEDEEEDDEDEDEDEEDDEDEEEDEDEEDDEDEEEDEDEDEDDERPKKKVFANNQKALKKAYERLRLPWETTKFSEHQTVTTSTPIYTLVENIEDDTQRELAFYKASLEATGIAKKKLLQQKIPFHRPLDYFAEMLKTDDHMERLKQRLIQEESEKLARQEARRQRNLKKFGKQVQIQTMQKRQQEKKDTLDKIKTLRKKRTANEITGGSEFDIAVEDVIDGKSTSDDKNKRQKVNHKREGKNKKFGSGGLKRFKRKNDAESSAGIPNKKFGKNGKGKKRY
ncbi:Ebp2-domain-containing protein [Hanseniaspora valbyensis NRRL Y-1626]|uniref:Ebp2-domain-containing protein n=1 Tax=Hanseniaspora valbyensis NRRL Y-1626 TaxID=766949 RepID=A0A1B7TIX9_9ASCO|nr:Ebp2-domain-containing protein [Hanseniaspora valbyensis NRRL Y-1626]